MTHTTDSSSIANSLRGHIPELRRLVSARFSLTPEQLDAGFMAPDEPLSAAELAEEAAILVSAFFSEHVVIEKTRIPATTPILDICPDIDERMSDLSWDVTWELSTLSGRSSCHELYMNSTPEDAPDGQPAHLRWRPHLVYLLTFTLLRELALLSAWREGGDAWLERRDTLISATGRASRIYGEAAGRISMWLNRERGHVFDETVEGLMWRLALLYERYPQAAALED